MKKLLFVFALGATLASCGGKTPCDCLSEIKALTAETQSALGDMEKSQELAEKAQALQKDCEAYKEEDYKDCK
tara:strand:+ start:1720 stop:1938 length:219 start_codon:yes stop_codon:yes gene_type:complete